MNRHDRSAAALRQLYRLDFPLFCTEQLKIRPLAGGELIPLEFTPSQALCWQRVVEQRQTQGYVRGIVLKPRQSGFSTLWEAIMYWLASLYSNVSTLLVAADPKSTQAIFRMAQLMFRMTDSTIRPLISANNREEMNFSNPDKATQDVTPGLMSRMDFQTAKTGIAGTGTTRQGIHLSEVAKWSEDLTDDLMTSLMPSIQRLPNTYGVMESTAFEGGDFFREMCEEAEKAEVARFKGDVTGGGFDYFFHFAPWWVDAHKNAVPLLAGEKIEPNGVERELMRYAEKGFPKDFPHLRVGPHILTPEQIKFRRVECKALGSEESFDQEYPRNPRDAWINRDDYVFDRKAMAKLRAEISPPKEFVEIDLTGPRLFTAKKSGNVLKNQDYVAVWQRPIVGIQYDIGLDTAMGGDQGDWTYAVVLRRDTSEQVAEYHKHILPSDCAREMFWLGRTYNTAQLIIEMNLGPGMVVQHALDSAGYPYLYMWRNFDRPGLPLTPLSGWVTNVKSKHIMVSMGADRLIRGKLGIKSKVLFDEMALYVRIYDRYEASRGHDDGVMALLMAIIGGEHEGHLEAAEPPPKITEEQTHEALRSIATHDDFEPKKRDWNNEQAQELALMRGFR